MVDPDSVIPNLGASGAISGVLGAYLVLFPRNKVNAVLFFRMMSVPAILVLGMWGAMQIWSGASTITAEGQSGGVAYMAHIGGFVAGLLIGLLARFMMKKEPDSGIYRPVPSSRSLSEKILVGKCPHAEDIKAPPGNACGRLRRSRLWMA